MVNFTEIDEARKILRLSDTATLKEIKEAYRTLSHRYHPDKYSDAESQDDEFMKKINWAYELLRDYCNDYKYSFKHEDVARTYPSEEYMRNWRKNWFSSI